MSPPLRVVVVVVPFSPYDPSPPPLHNRQIRSFFFTPTSVWETLSAVKSFRTSVGKMGIATLKPIGLSAGISSMEKDVIPFIPVRFGSFVGLVFVFGVLGIVICIVQLSQVWCWDRRIRGPRLEMLRSGNDSSLDTPTTKPHRDVENEAD
jgi:hypothetical protein